MMDPNYKGSQGGLKPYTLQFGGSKAPGRAGTLDTLYNITNSIHYVTLCPRSLIHFYMVCHHTKKRKDFLNKQNHMRIFYNISIKYPTCIHIHMSNVVLC